MDSLECCVVTLQNTRTCFVFFFSFPIHPTQSFKESEGSLGDGTTFYADRHSLGLSTFAYIYSFMFL